MPRDPQRITAPPATRRLRPVVSKPPQTNVGDGQEAALIEKHEMRAPTRGVFLSAAIRLADRAVSHSELPTNDVANALERPQLGGVSGRSSAAP